MSPTVSWRILAWIEKDAIKSLANLCDGDARCALNSLQMAIQSQRAEQDGMVVVTADDIREVLQRNHVLYDRAGATFSQFSLFFFMLASFTPFLRNLFFFMEERLQLYFLLCPWSLLAVSKNFCTQTIKLVPVYNEVLGTCNLFTVPTLVYYEIPTTKKKHFAITKC